MKYKKICILMSLVSLVSLAYTENKVSSSLFKQNEVFSSALQESDTGIVSAYQFRSCYKFKFNKDGITTNPVNYTVYDNNDAVVERGIVNSSHPDLLFCEHNVFEKKSQRPHIEELQKGYYLTLDTVLGIDYSKQHKSSTFYILLSNSTQKNVDMVSKINFTINHNFNFSQNERNNELKQSIHTGVYKIDYPGAVLSILNNETDLKPTNDIMYSSKYRDSSVVRSASDAGSTADGYYTYKGYYYFGFKPRIMSSVELTTFKVNYDSNPYILTDPVNNISSASFSYYFDYANKTGANGTFVYSDYLINTNYFGDVSKHVVKIDNMDSVAYACSAFDYDHQTNSIYGYCFEKLNGGIDTEHWGEFINSFTLNLNKCWDNHLKFSSDGRSLECATNRI